jgi:hypothetical protein
MKTADCVIGLGFLGLSGWFYISAAALPASFSYGDPGPAELPKLIAIICAIAAVAFIIQSVGAPVAPDRIHLSRKGIAFTGWTILATIGIVNIGTVPALAIYIFGGIVLLVGRSGLPLAAFCAVVITGAVYSLFHLLLSVPLP